MSKSAAIWIFMALVISVVVFLWLRGRDAPARSLRPPVTLPNADGAAILSSTPTVTVSPSPVRLGRQTSVHRAFRSRHRFASFPIERFYNNVRAIQTLRREVAIFRRLLVKPGNAQNDFVTAELSRALIRLTNEKRYFLEMKAARRSVERKAGPSAAS